MTTQASIVDDVMLQPSRILRVSVSGQRTGRAGCLPRVLSPPALVPWDGVGWRQERGAEARLGRPLPLCLTTTTPELSIFNAHCQQSRAR